MYLMLSLVFIISFVFLLLGFIQPKIVLFSKNKTRKKAFKIYGITCLLSFIALVVVASKEMKSAKNQDSNEISKKSEIENDIPNVIDEPSIPEKIPFEYADIPVSDWKLKPAKTRKDMVESFIKSENIDPKLTHLFYNCLSQFSWMENDTARLDFKLSECTKLFNDNSDALNSKVNFDNFSSNFSAWDGSYRPVTNMIKSVMNDEDSFEHVQTTYIIHPNVEKDATATITTIFKGRNAFNAIVKETIHARVDIKSGEVIEIVE